MIFTTYVVVKQHQSFRGKPIGALQFVHWDEWRLSCSVLSVDLRQKHLHEHRRPSVRSVGRDNFVQLLVSAYFLVIRHYQTLMNGGCDILTKDENTSIK